MLKKLRQIWNLPAKLQKLENESAKQEELDHWVGEVHDKLRSRREELDTLFDSSLDVQKQISEIETAVTALNKAVDELKRR